MPLIYIVYMDILITGYMDIGDQSFMCEECGANMWSLERVDKRLNNNSPTFQLCCRKGKIALPILQEPPQLLSSLLHGHDSRSKHFMERIRGHNMMFTFTSMGGKLIKLLIMVVGHMYSEFEGKHVIE